MTRLIDLEEIEKKSAANRAAHGPGLTEEQLQAIAIRNAGRVVSPLGHEDDPRQRIEKKPTSKGGSKYKAIRTTIDGVTFASKREAKRYGELKLFVTSGAISNLRCQVPFKIFINGKLICKWLADFVYQENGAEIVEDCKGFRTPVYKLKKKMVEAEFGLIIRET